MQFWFAVLNVATWGVLFLLHALQFRPASLSAYELKRRAESGDDEALSLQERETLLPRLETLRRVVVAVVLTLAVATTTTVWGWVLGILFASLLSLSVWTVSRFGFITSIAQKLYAQREKWLLETVKSWQWLDWVRGATFEREETAAASKAELQTIVERSRDVLSRDELLRLQASFALDSRTVEDVMTPVSVLDVADVKDTLGPLVLDDLHKTGHSRFPVTDGDIHHVVGILYLHDIINLSNSKATVREAMDPRVHYIHQEQSLEHALNGFLKTHRHLFVVVNDYRETVGVLTLEDVLETLLGKKIVDEFDKYDDLRAVAESNPRKNNVPKGKTDI